MKHLRSLLLIIAASLLLAACGGGGGGGGGSAASIEGTWEVIEVKSGEMFASIPEGMGITMVYSAGNYTYSTPDECVEQGTYVVDSSTITSTTTADTCDPEDVGDVDVLPYSVTSTTLTIGNDSVYILFEKR